MHSRTSVTCPTQPTLRYLTAGNCWRTLPRCHDLTRATAKTRRPHAEEGGAGKSARQDTASHYSKGCCSVSGCFRRSCTTEIVILDEPLVSGIGQAAGEKCGDIYSGMKTGTEAVMFHAHSVRLPRSCATAWEDCRRKLRGGRRTGARSWT